jgi:2Fe-2S ferredoxin
MVVDSTKTLTILENFVDLQFKEPVLVLDFLNANKISIDQSCGGNGTCTTCRFIVRDGLTSFSQRTETEQERADERNFLATERLACQTTICDSAVIEIPI